jgi:hypothetical protein
LAVTVLNGAVAVDAATQNENEDLEIKAGSTSLAVRGTFFLVENKAKQPIVFTMFEGEALIDGTQVLSAGYKLTTAPETGLEGAYTLERIELEKLSYFSLETIIENKERLSDVFSDSDFAKINELFENMPEPAEEYAPEIATEVIHITDTSDANRVRNVSDLSANRGGTRYIKRRKRGSLACTYLCTDTHRRADRKT